MPKYVVSSTLREPLEWNAHLVKGDLAEEVTKLTQQEGADILVNGSARLVQALADSDLVDVYHLMSVPDHPRRRKAAVRRHAGRDAAPPCRGEVGRPRRRDDHDL